MALVQPKAVGLTRVWELVSTAIASATYSNVATSDGVHSILGVIYVVTSNVPSMTIQIQESTDNSNWITVEERVITASHAYKIEHPWLWMRVNVSSWTSGQIDSVVVLGVIQ